MEKLFRTLMAPDMDVYSRAEVMRYAEKIIDEHIKIRGQIARDLSRLGVDAWREDSAYRKLKAKYLAHHQSKRNWRFLKWNASLIVNRRKDYDAQSVNYGDS